MSYAALLKKHLMSIYMRLEKIEKGLTDYRGQLNKQAKDIKNMDAKIREKLDEKASALNQQLTEIDSKLTKGNADLQNGLENLKGELDSLAKEKLKAGEFHRFVDKLVEALTENLPSPPLEAESIEGEKAPPNPPPTEEITKPSSKGSKRKD